MVCPPLPHPRGRALTLALLGVLWAVLPARPAAGMGCHAADRPVLGLGWDAAEDPGLGPVAEARPAGAVIPRPCSGDVPGPSPRLSAPDRPPASAAGPVAPDRPVAGRLRPDSPPLRARLGSTPPERPPRRPGAAPR